MKPSAHHEHCPLILLLAGTVTAGQGNAVRLTVPNEPGISAVEIQWQKKNIPYVAWAPSGWPSSAWIWM